MSDATMYLRPPNAEAALLAACMHGSKAYYEALDHVTPADFWYPGNRAVFAAIGRVLESGAKPDPHVVWEQLREDRSLLADDGGPSFISSLFDMLFLPGNVREYAKEVRRDADKRRLHRALEEALEQVEAGKATLPDVQERLYHLESRTDTEGCTLQEAMQQLYREADSVLSNPPVNVCTWPWPDVQAWTRGLRPGWLCILAGEPSHGKTAAALAVMYHLLKAEKRVLYCTAEMAPRELALRLAQSRGYNADMHYVKPDSANFAKLNELEQTFRQHQGRLESVYRVDQIPPLIRRYKPACVIVDHLQLLDIGRDTRLEGTTKNTRALKLMAQRYDLPVLCLSQLSRPQHRGNTADENAKLPSLYRLRDSGSLEQDADIVMFVWRNRDGQQVLTERGKFIVAKSRMGRTGAIGFSFKGATQQFEVDSRWSQP